MSGGHWDHRQYGMTSFLQDAADDETVIERFPKLAKLLGELGDALGKVAHDLDWDLSGDTLIKDDVAFEQAALDSLRMVLDDSRHDAEEPYAYFVRELREERRNCVMCGGCEAVLHTEHVIEHNAGRGADETIECPTCRAQYEMYWLRCLD